MNEDFNMFSELSSLTDIELEKYIESKQGSDDPRVSDEILIRLFKARRVTVDDLMDASSEGYSGRNWTKDSKCPNCGQRFYT